MIEDKGINEDGSKRYVVLHDPRNNIDLLPQSMRDWLNEHPEWPLKALGREDDAVPWERFEFHDIPKQNAQDRYIKPGDEVFGITEPTFDNIDNIYSQKQPMPDRPAIDRILNTYRARVIALTKLPLFKQYVAFYNKEIGLVHDQPWQVLGQRIYAACHLLLAADGKMPFVGTTYEDDWEKKRALTVATAWILRATPYLWLPEVEKIAAASPLPKHVVSQTVLPNPVMFWSCRPSVIVQQWMLIMHARSGIMIFGLGATEKSEQCVGYDFIDYGQTWPSGDFAKRDGTEGILQRCAFLSSPYVSPEPQRLQRHQRRQMERAGAPQESTREPIHVVKLRRRADAAQRKAQPPTGEHHDVEWQHQWWVSAHYRAQWYPTEQAHKVIWIEPYLKGPSDKPILDKMYAVIR